MTGQLQGAFYEHPTGPWCDLAWAIAQVQANLYHIGDPISAMGLAKPKIPRLLGLTAKRGYGRFITRSPTGPFSAIGRNPRESYHASPSKDADVVLAHFTRPHRHFFVSVSDFGYIGGRGA